MAATKERRTVEALLEEYGRTYAQDAGISLKNTPQPLYRLLVLASLLSTRIRAKAAVDASRELTAAGMRDPHRMAEATWQERVDALGRGGYRRYDESTATRLGQGAEMVDERYGGDLRRLRAEADGDVAELSRALQAFPGVGPVGADIFLREAQAVWPEAAPYLDAKALQGAEALDLPTTPDRLLRLAGDVEPAVLAAALVRVVLDRHGPETVREKAAGRTG